MVTFSGQVRYISHEGHTTQRGQHRQRYSTIKVKDVDTKRVYWLYDWSGDTHNGTLMHNHRHELLFIQGYLNSAGKTNFAVLQRWGVWDVSRMTVLHPVTRRDGFIEVEHGRKE